MEDSETSSQLSSEDGEERGLRDEVIAVKELGRGNTGQKEMAEVEEEDLDEEEGKPGIDKEQKGEETHRGEENRKRKREAKRQKQRKGYKGLFSKR